MVMLTSHEALLNVRSPAQAVRPTVGAIVPCYNYGRYLPACVESILSQDGVDVSVLIIDDCSTDGSDRVAALLADADERVEAVVHRANRGHIATYNEGIEWVTGDYTLLLSADDLLVPGALARAAAAFEANPDVALVYGRAVLFPDGTAPPAPRVSSRTKVWSGADWVASRCRLGRTGIESPEAILRTEVHQAVGGYRPELPHTADSELWLRAAHHGDVAYVCADQAYHRTHPASMSSSRFGALNADYDQRRAAFDTALLGGQKPFAHAADLHAVAMHALAADLLWRVCRELESRRSADLAVPQLLELARRICPEADALPEMRSLAWRRGAGSGARYLLPLAFPAMVRRRVRRLQHEYGSLWWRHVRP